MTEAKYSLTELEHMIPWERAIYMDMLNKWIEKKNEFEKQQNKLNK